jgi:hypothetical protein
MEYKLDEDHKSLDERRGKTGPNESKQKQTKIPFSLCNHAVRYTYERHHRPR